MSIARRNPLHEESKTRFVEFVRDLDDDDDESFDRLGYAAAVLRLLAPRRMTVALCAGTGRLVVKEGRELDPRRGARWAIVSIPPRASRAHIAYALASLVGRAGEPYLLDVLVSGAPAGGLAFGRPAGVGGALFVGRARAAAACPGPP